MMAPGKPDGRHATHFHFFLFKFLPARPKLFSNLGFQHSQSWWVKVRADPTRAPLPTLDQGEKNDLQAKRGKYDLQNKHLKINNFSTNYFFHLVLSIMPRQITVGSLEAH